MARSLKIWTLMLAAGIAKLLRPLVTIRFGCLFVSRVGHLTGNTECYLCEKDAGINRPKRVFDIWTPLGVPANEQLLKMYSRVMPIWRWALGVHAVGNHLQGWRDAHTFSDEQWGRDIHNLMEKSPPHIAFTAEEEKRGLEGLRALGMPEGAKWVCIVNRDPMYLRAMQPGQDYSYHSFRDSNIDNYREAAVALMERGYWVLRMGQFVEAPMKLQGPQFIEYACSGRRSDFMDVYLGAKCHFTISNGTGFDGIPMIFRRPICFVNEAPFEYLSTWMADSLAIWKHHCKGAPLVSSECGPECKPDCKIPGYDNLHIRQGVRMYPKEIIASGAGLFSRTEQFSAAGIELVENTPEEIKDVALEMDDRLKGVLGSAEEEERQHLFWAHYPLDRKSPFNGAPLHGGQRLRIGTKFLASYAN